MARSDSSGAIQLLRRILRWDPPLYVSIPLLAAIAVAMSLVFDRHVFTGPGISVFVGSTAGVVFHKLRRAQAQRQSVQ